MSEEYGEKKRRVAVSIARVLQRRIRWEGDNDSSVGNDLEGDILRLFQGLPADGDSKHPGNIGQFLREYCPIDFEANRSCRMLS